MLSHTVPAHQFAYEWCKKGLRAWRADVDFATRDFVLPKDSSKQERNWSGEIESFPAFKLKVVVTQVICKIISKSC